MSGGEYGDMTAALRDFLDNVASAGLRADTTALADDLRSWTTRLAALQVKEADRVFGRRFDLPDRGQTMTPLFTPTTLTGDRAEGTVRFGGYFLGSGGAAHGGAVPLLFDEVLGHIAVKRGQRSRTAFLHTDFRAITPIDRDLSVRAWVEETSGRKVFMRAELHDDSVLCAEARALFVVLRDGAA